MAKVEVEQRAREIAEPILAGEGLELVDKLLEPLVTEADLTRHGLEPGPRLKRLLDAVREAQLKGTVKTKKEALELDEIGNVMYTNRRRS